MSKIFVAGATGAIGKRLIPLLVEAGHHVIGTTRSHDKANSIRAAGATPAILNALDRDEVLRAVQHAAPDVIIHQLTAIPPSFNPRHFDKVFAATNQLRTEGTDHLLAAARAVKCRRFIAQSYAGWPFARSGGPVKTEEDALDPNPPSALRNTLEAIRYLERAIPSEESMDGIVLRYAGFYGPGNAIGEGGALVEQVRQRRVPVVGKGTGIWSFVHIDDAARATAAAIDRGTRGIYNVADDEPAPVSEWLPALASAIGAKPPMRIPIWLARLVVGEAGVMMMTEVRGASNAKAKRELSWQPVWSSWRQGFQKALGG